MAVVGLRLALRSPCGRRSGCRAVLVKRQEQAVTRGVVTVDAQKSQSRQGVADPQDSLQVPERQQVEQVRVADVQPAQAVALRGGLVPIDGPELLHQHRFLEAHGRGQFGGELQLRVVDGVASGHGHKRRAVIAGSERPHSIPSLPAKL